MEETGKFDMENRLYVPWDFDVANQQKGIEDAIAQDVDAIMLTSLSRAGLAASVERATAAGIPVILCMAGAETDEFIAEVSAEMPRMGYDSAQAVAEKIGGAGKIVMIHGIAGCRRRRVLEARRQDRVRRVPRHRDRLRAERQLVDRRLTRR